MGFRLNIFGDSKKSSSNASAQAERKRRNRKALRVESLEERRLLSATPYGASANDLGEFLLGTVAVTPVFLESDGSIDQSTEDWSQTHIDEVLANIDEGLDWWVETLARQNTVHELSFTVDTTFAQTPASSSYEGISRRSNDFSLYVSEFLTGQGYTTGTLETNIREFNHAQRVKHDTDWSFTMFVVPSENDPDGQFASGGSFSRAFAFAGGLFMIVPSTRPASTFTHETGHMFWARDEYPGGGSYFARRGYYNTQNENASNNPNPGFVQQPSIMAAGTLLETAYANYTSPASTLAMLGWQDSDSNGIFDVLDVPHRLTGSGYFDEATGEYKFNGSAVVQTLPNLNSSGLGNDITINRITHIEYRVDGGEWLTATMPDEYEVDLDLAINIPANANQIEIRARDSGSTVVSNVFRGVIGEAARTAQQGVTGHVWIDTNKNTLRDFNELGAGGWTVELVDASGSRLQTEQRIEPDDLPDGQIASGFRPGLTLTSTGTDADGRVAVFADSSASTGSKTFRGFSRGAATYMSTWTDASRQLQVNFSSPTSVVSIDVIGASSRSYGRIDAFDSAGNLVSRQTSEELSLGEVARLEVSSPDVDIAYVNIGGHAFSSVKLDDLRYGASAVTTTDALGGYALENLPTGQYNVRVTPLGGYRNLDSSSFQTVSVTAGLLTADVDFGFETSTSQWQNPVDPLDVNDDGFIAPIDVLQIVNEINANGARDLRGTLVSTPPYIDVSGDSFVTALDALLIVNELNS